jgi:hypothetical protein
MAPDSVGSFTKKVPVDEGEVFRSTFLKNIQSQIMDPEKRPLIVVFPST